MIQFTVWKTGHQYKGFVCKGHAGYADAGEDIVCSAVSVLTVNTVNSIEEFTEDSFQVEQAEDGGYLSVCFPDPLSQGALLLMDSLVLGIRSVQAEYGSQYITLLFEEV